MNAKFELGSSVTVSYESGPERAIVISYIRVGNAYDYTVRFENGGTDIVAESELSLNRVIPLTFEEFNRVTAAEEITRILDEANPWNETSPSPARETKRAAEIRTHHWFPNEDYDSSTPVFGVVQGNYDQFRENCVWLADYATDESVNKVRAYVYAVWAAVEFGTAFPDPICIPGAHNDYHTYYAIAK